MGSGASKPGWYPGEPITGEVPDGECSCDPAATAGLGSGGGYGATTKGTTPSSQRIGGSFGTNESREITSLPVVELTDIKFIANGAFCSVFACKYRGWNVVAKRVRADLPLTERRAALDNLWTEYDCLRPLRHPNVIDVYGMCRVKCRDDYCDWNEKDVCLLLEQLALGTVGHLFGTTFDVEKNLATALARSRKMKMVPFRCRLDRAMELALALKYVHGGAGIGTMMHRDIKSVNVGFALNGSLKLMDFGLSKIVAPDGAPENDTYQMTGEVGSYRYMAPELVRHEPYNAKADIYSWAILSWEVLAVSRPYTGITESSFIKRVVMDGHRPELRKSWPERLGALLASAWHADFSKRPTAAEIVSALEEIKADLPEREQRRPSTAAPPFGGATHSRSNSRTQRSVSAPGSICHARGPSIHSGGGGGGGSGGGNAPPPASPTQRRISLPLNRAPSAANRRWSFGAKTSSRSRKEEAKTKATLPLPPTRSVSSTTPTANTAEDDEGVGVAAADMTSPPCHRHHHQEGKSQREIIAEALAREAEVAQQEASAKQVVTMRALGHLGRGVGRVADRERRYAEHQARGVGATGPLVSTGGEGGEEEEEEGGGDGAGLRTVGKDDIFDVASVPSQVATEEALARLSRDISVETVAEELPANLLHHDVSQETVEDVPISICRRHSNSQEKGEISSRIRRHSSIQETGEESGARADRHTSLEATAGEVVARVNRHTDLEASEGGAADRLNRGSSLSKLWPSKSNWSNNPEDASAEPWAWRTSRNGSVGLHAATTTLPGDEQVDNDGSSHGRPAAMSGATAGKSFASVAPTGVRDLRKKEWPANNPRNPRAYALEANSVNLLERAPL